MEMGCLPAYSPTVMGQRLCSDEQAEPPRTLVMELRCDCGKCFGFLKQAYSVYVGHDYIVMRGEATAEGWKRSGARWLFKDHI